MELGAVTPQLATLVYAIRDGEVLLHRRTKAPNLGLWVAPGGKLEPGESPAECAIREMREESAAADYCGVFVATRFTGTLAPADGIGEFRWVAVPDVFALPIPAPDRFFFGRIVRLDDPPFLLKFSYDEELRIVRMDER